MISPFCLAAFALFCNNTAPERTQPTTYSIPIIDISHETERQVVIESTPGQYLGHPTTVLLRDNKTIFVTYPLGHGGPAAVLSVKSDTTPDAIDIAALQKELEGRGFLMDIRKLG